MRIDSLHLTAFGKFKSRKITLGPGLNVIFGPNEAGKSTVERFLFGMLYGFAVAGRGRRYLRPEMEKYRPWGGGAYEGRIVFSLEDGRCIRVEREFDPHAVSVYDDVTGDEIDCELDRRREPVFAQEMLDVSGPEFEGTVCIGQMKTADIEEEGTTAIAEHMARALTGGEGESAEKAMAILAQREGEIGSEKAPTRPYAMALDKAREVKERLENVESERSSNLEREVRLRELQKKLAELKAQEGGLAKQIEVAARAELRAVVERVSGHLDRAAEHEEKARESEERLEPLRPLAEIPHEDALGAPDRFKVYGRLREAEADAETEMTKRREEVSSLEKELEGLGIEGGPDKIEAALEDLEERTSQAERQHGSKATAAAAAMMGRALWAVLAVLALVAAVGLGIGLSPYAFGLVVPSAIFVLLAVRAGAAQRAQLTALQEEIESYKHRLRVLTDEHGCSNTGALKRKLDAATDLARKLEKERDVLSALEGRESEAAQSVLHDILEIFRAASPCSARLAASVDSGNVGEADVEEFISLYRAHMKTSQAVKASRDGAAEAWRLAAENARGLKSIAADWVSGLREACGSKDLAQARATVQAARRALGEGDAGPSEHTGRSASKLRQEHQGIQQEIVTRTGESEKLSGQIEEAYRNLGDPGKLEREKLETEEKLAGLDLQLRAIARARDIIERVAEEMHRDFAPGLARRVEPIVASLTGGRYASVRIGEDLRLAAEIPETGELVSVKELSAGTLDQFYFALRVGAALELASGGEKPPIICDESLVQYDDERALACLKYLHELGSEYQILLLTCHERERKAALDLSANVIAL